MAPVGMEGMNMTMGGDDPTVPLVAPQGSDAASAQLEAAREAGRPPHVEDLPPSGPNALVRAAHSLLLLAGTLRASVSVDDIGALWNRSAVELRRFASRAAEAGVDARTVSTAHYVLCAVLDEAVLRSPWGARSPWHRKSLLMAHHGDTYGGETFFVILDRLSVDLERQLDLAELMYFCLLLGFGGRHLAESDGAVHLSERRDDLQRRIAAVRGATPRALSPAWRGLARPWRAQGRLPWIVVACALCVAAATWVYLYRHIAILRTDLNARLAAATYALPPVATNDAPTVPDIDQESGARSLRQWIDVEGALDGVDVVEEGTSSTVLRLSAGGWFPSGSAAMPKARREQVARLAKAFDHVRGMVVVVGHTDDQPIRAGRFENNVELSLARARHVAAVLAEGLDDPARVSFRGVGATQPIATPPDLPAHRERNRRVDIFFYPETP